VLLLLIAVILLTAHDAVAGSPPLVGWAQLVAGIAAGFGVIWALGWRRQEQAVAAIEERDGVRFYVERTPPLSPIKLIRTPGFGGDFLRSVRQQ